MQLVCSAPSKAAATKPGAVELPHCRSILSVVGGRHAFTAEVDIRFDGDRWDRYFIAWTCDGARKIDYCSFNHVHERFGLIRPFVAALYDEDRHRRERGRSGHRPSARHCS